MQATLSELTNTFLTASKNQANTTRQITPKASHFTEFKTLSYIGGSSLSWWVGSGGRKPKTTLPIRINGVESDTYVIPSQYICCQLLYRKALYLSSLKYISKLIVGSSIFIIVQSCGLKSSSLLHNRDREITPSHHSPLSWTRDTVSVERENITDHISIMMTTIELHVLFQCEVSAVQCSEQGRYKLTTNCSYSLQNFSLFSFNWLQELRLTGCLFNSQ